MRSGSNVVMVQMHASRTAAAPEDLNQSLEGRVRGDHGRPAAILAFHGDEVIHGLSSRPRPETLAYPDLGFNRHARPEHVFPSLSRIERDLHRNSLHNFHEVTGGVFRWQQAGDRAAGPSDTLYMAFVVLAGGVDVNRDGLIGSHIAELGFFEVGRDPEVVEIDD